MLRRIAQTTNSHTQMLLRITLGVVMFPHGAQKLLGWFGGAGLGGTVDFLGTLGIPAFVAVTVVLIEFFGSIALLAGVFTRFAAAGVAAVMLGAVATVHISNGFFMNWTGAQAGEGFEYHLLVLGIALVLMVKGSGALSIDRKIAGKTQ